MVPNARRTGGQPPHEYEYCIPFRTSFSCCIDVRRTCHSCPSLIVSSLHMHCNGRAVLERREREHSTRPSFVVCCLEMSCVSPLKCQMAENTFISLLRGCVCTRLQVWVLTNLFSHFRDDGLRVVYRARHYSACDMQTSFSLKIVLWLVSS